MKHSEFCKLVEAIESFIEEFNDPDVFFLGNDTAENMARAAAAVLDATIEAQTYNAREKNIKFVNSMCQAL